MKATLLILLLSAPAWGLPILSGNDLRSGAPVKWRGDTLSVVVFLSASCPCSNSHEPGLAALAQKYPQIPFVGILSNDASAQSAAHFAKGPIAFALLREPGHQWADAFGALNTPHAFLVDAGGKVLFEGGVDDSRDAKRASRGFLAQALAEVAAGKPVSQSRARPLGCAIRR
jgi:hypothetical protein